MNAPEISPRTLNSIANEQYLSGWELVKAKVDMAKLGLKNDYIGLLRANGMAANVSFPTIEAAQFKREVIASSPLERGIIWDAAVNSRYLLEKRKLKSVTVYPKQTINGAVIYVYDSFEPDTAWSYTVNLVADTPLTIETDLPIIGNSVKVFMAAEIQVNSTYLNCSCDGSLPNGYGTIKGWDGANYVSREGYGLNIQIQTYCDFDSVICDLQQGFTGELLFLKSRILILEEHLSSTRFNNWVAYNTERATELLASLRDEYVSKWNDLVGASNTVLRKYNERCLTCKRARWVTNL